MEEVLKFDEIKSDDGFFLPNHETFSKKILWKKDPNEPVQIYKLKTVTYGATPACYLSTLVLKQLAMDEKDNFPIAGNAVLQDVYLDDIITGYSSIQEFELLKIELILLFKSPGMSLHKWCFSHANSESPDLNFNQLSDETVTTLVFLWNSSSYTFCFNVSLPTNSIFTKRDVLSQTARPSDPLGLLRPIIKNPERIALLGFADASEKGFAAVVYVPIQAKNGNKNWHLLCSKSRVAPLKTLSILRLEISACFLLSKLEEEVPFRCLNERAVTRVVVFYASD
ncbi:hypothetical protein HNY73_022390 [Argiope bruennichi]|uniref:Reverse transcriptase domain-containing protein n=1 Tax=Argiope bruennichi TaxID=94029 RepID=A0A8T0E2B9_ARGBR|nr:hypothetical protein HNY73_022390 [Argiope bruennichi]